MSLIQERVSLLPYNTLAVDARAMYFAEVFSLDQLRLLMQESLRNTVSEKLILWWGSNILFTQDFPWLVVKNSLLWKDIIEETDTCITVRVWAGENWDEFVQWAVNHNYGDVENLAMIPGCVWATPMQNIWAYGMEVKDVIQSVEYIDMQTWELVSLLAEECAFAYRDSVFKQSLKWKVIIVAVIFHLQKISTNYSFRLDYKDIENYISEKSLDVSSLLVADVADMVRVIRSRKLPDRTKIGTAGSFFKNPYVDLDTSWVLKKEHSDIVGFLDGSRVKLSAGWLIEHAWLKWTQWWKVWTYQNHALILVNHGWNGKDIVAVAQEIQARVLDSFGVKLEPEVNYV